MVLTRRIGKNMTEAGWHLDGTCVLQSLMFLMTYLDAYYIDREQVTYTIIYCYQQWVASTTSTSNNMYYIINNTICQLIYSPRIPILNHYIMLLELRYHSCAQYYWIGHVYEIFLLRFRNIWNEYETNLKSIDFDLSFFFCGINLMLRRSC